MKKAILLIMLVSQVVNAKVSDFNALIDDNVAAQKQLHTEVKTSVDETRTALNEGKNPTVIVDHDSDSLNVPTSKNMLRFKKEIVEHQVKDKQAQKRLANEFQSADMEF